jgi:hypothetical protein
MSLHVFQLDEGVFITFHSKQPTSWNYWVFGLFPPSGILENTTFRKLDLFLSSSEGEGKTPIQLGLLERAN